MTKKRSGDAESDIETLLGIATGCVGMSISDFERCTPSEFTSIATRWRSMRDQDRKDRWERMRTLATVFLAPWTRKKLNPKEVIPLAWDKKDNPAQPERSTIERMKKMEAKAKKASGPASSRQDTPAKA